MSTDAALSSSAGTWISDPREVLALLNAPGRKVVGCYVTSSVSENASYNFKISKADARDAMMLAAEWEEPVEVLFTGGLLFFF